MLHYNKRKAKATLNSGWSRPYIVLKKLGVCNYEIQEEGGPIKRAHVDDMRFDPGAPYRKNFVRDEQPPNDFSSALEENLYADKGQEEYSAPAYPLRRSERLANKPRLDYSEQ